MINKILRKLTNIKIYLDSIQTRIYLFFSKQKKGTNNSKREFEIVVSLTTIPSRIDFVKTPIECIFNQKMKADRIILWLDKNKFDEIFIDNKFKNLISRGLEIKYVEDVGVHTKYFYALKNHKDSIIVTIDDDIYYSRMLIHKLYMKYKKYPQSIIAMRAHEITFDSNGDISPYNSWLWNSYRIKKPSHRLIQTGVGGVLYPPHCLHLDSENSDLFRELSPKNDDIWLKIMALMVGTKVIKANRFYSNPVEIRNSQEVSLNSVNVKKNQNDIQLHNLIEYYHLDMHSLLKE